MASILGEVLDFPARCRSATRWRSPQNLAGALFDMAETNLLAGEALPLPDPKGSDPDADLEEPLYLRWSGQ